MSKAFFTHRGILIKFLFLAFISFFATSALAKETHVVITSETLTVDNKNNMAIFKGSVVAKSEDIIIYSNKMEVFYDDSLHEIIKIRAYGNVKAHKEEQVIFSKEATYLGQEKKIVFTGEPKAVDGENVITGTQIIYLLNEGRTIVKGSRVILKKQEE